MNKKECNEIKKLFTPAGCAIGRICGCYVDAEKNKRTELKEAFLSLPEEEAFKYFPIFRNALSGTVGKNLINMEFPLHAEKEGGTQEFLLKLRDSQLKDNTLIEEFYDRIIENFDYGENYYIILIHCAYDIPAKATDGSEMFDASDYVYEFIQCTICPVKLSKAGLFYNSVANSFKYMALSVPIQLVLSLVIAYILTSIIRRGATVFRTMYFVPVVTTASIVGIIMIFIFGGTGPVNQLLSLLGIDTINFLGDEKTALFTVVLIGIWKDLGTYMIYWIAALQSVSQDVYEAAKIDGAGKFRTFTDVVFPLILPIGGVIAVLCVIGSLKVFDIVQTMTNGGPYFATDVVATFVYRTAYSSTTGSPRLGYASAAALLFGLMVVIIGLVLNGVKTYFNKKRNI